MISMMSFPFFVTSLEMAGKQNEGEFVQLKCNQIIEMILFFVTETNSE